MSLFALVAAVIAVSAPGYAATNTGARAASSADLTGAPATRTRENVNYNKYQTRTTTRTYQSRDTGNLYYTTPSNRSAMYKNYVANNGGAARTSSTTTTTTTNVRSTTRAETVRSEMRRKYYLAHPFYQPLKGKFGSITDLSYTNNSYDLKFVDNNVLTIFDKDYPEIGLTLNGQSGKWKTNQFAVKEDFSYGITDKLAVLVMARYDSSEYKFDWSDGTNDKEDDNGLNMYGGGVQWRMIDDAKWIGMASAYYQHQKDVANSFILELKGGYKVSRSTLYGLVRGWYVDIDGDNNAYGAGVSGSDSEGYDATMFLAYNNDASNIFYVEGGIGTFSVLDEDWTLNVEAVFGHYDWHNQATIKGAIGWQPNDWFALNLYAKTAFYDSADDKKLDFYFYRANTVDANGYDYIGLSPFGKAKLSNYSETSVGLQAIFQF